MPAKKNQRAVVLLSGGIDSSTCLALASGSYRCHALTLQYGQRNACELRSAHHVAEVLEAEEHRVVELDLAWVGRSALLENRSGGPVPRSLDGVTPSPPPPDGIPATYVPARNSIFIAMGAAWAEALGTPHLFIGVNQVDYSGYPDCRPEFIQTMQRALRLGTRMGDLQIHTPLMDLSKAEIIRQGSSLGLDYSLTWSCYDPQGELACGLCDSCIHRKRGFSQSGIPDPTRYA